jgi:hypothetical protein
VARIAQGLFTSATKQRVNDRTPISLCVGTRMRCPTSSHRIYSVRHSGVQYAIIPQDCICAAAGDATTTHSHNVQLRRYSLYSGSESGMRHAAPVVQHSTLHLQTPALCPWERYHYFCFVTVQVGSGGLAGRCRAHRPKSRVCGGRWPPRPR